MKKAALSAFDVIYDLSVHPALKALPTELQEAIGKLLADMPPAAATGKASAKATVQIPPDQGDLLADVTSPADTPS